MMCCSVWRAAGFGALLTVAQCAAHAAESVVPGPPLRFEADTFAFANQTVYLYPHGYAEKRQLRSGEKPPAFTLRCFAMCRSAEQFHKFARFDASLPPPDDATLDRLLRRINRRAVWRRSLPLAQRVVIPGYADLRTLTRARPLLVQKNVGGGLSTYLRIGNWRMFSYWWNGPSQQADTRRNLDDVLARNDGFVAYLTAYPSLSINHAVLLYGRGPDTADGILRYRVYDPNHPEAPREMRFDPRKNEFSYQKDWDFVGGKVTVLRAYGRWLQ